MRMLFLLMLAVTLIGCDDAGQVGKDTEAAEQESTNPDATFTANGFTMIGKEDRLGFIYGEEIAFKAGKVNKYMWHFWGSEEELDGPVRIVAINEADEKHKVLARYTGSDVFTKVWEYEGAGGSNNGADAHMPSNMVLPEPGIWNLKVYIDDAFFGNVVVKVEEG